MAHTHTAYAPTCLLGPLMVHEDALLFSPCAPRNPRHRFCPDGLLTFFDAHQRGLASVHMSEYQQMRDTLSTATQQPLPTAFGEANVYILYIFSGYGRTCCLSSLQSASWCTSDLPCPNAPPTQCPRAPFFWKITLGPRSGRQRSEKIWLPHFQRLGPLRCARHWSSGMSTRQRRSRSAAPPSITE